MRYLLIVRVIKSTSNDICVAWGRDQTMGHVKEWLAGSVMLMGEIISIPFHYSCVWPSQTERFFLLEMIKSMSGAHFKNICISFVKQ